MTSKKKKWRKTNKLNLKPSTRKLKNQPQKHFGLSISIFIHIRVKMYAKEKPTSDVSTFAHIGVDMCVKEKPASNVLKKSQL